MKCPSLEELALYEDGALAREERAALAAHLDTCAQCRQEVTALRATARLLEAMPAPEMPADLWPGVAARLQAPRPHGWVRWWKVAMGAGVAASLLIGLAITRLQTPPPMPLASSTAATSYVSEHEFLSAQDPLADRASLGVLLAAQRSDHR